MSARAPLPQVCSAPDRGPVLVFAAHPGDEVAACGGALALHVRQGDAGARVIVAYDGAGAAPAEREELAARRRDERLAGAAHLGLAPFEFLDYPEGREPTPEELFFAARLLAGRIDESGDALRALARRAAPRPARARARRRARAGDEQRDARLLGLRDLDAAPGRARARHQPGLGTEARGAARTPLAAGAARPGARRARAPGPAQHLAAGVCALGRGRRSTPARAPRPGSARGRATRPESSPPPPSSPGAGVHHARLSTSVSTPSTDAPGSSAAAQRVRGAARALRPAAGAAGRVLLGQPWRERRGARRARAGVPRRR